MTSEKSPQTTRVDKVVMANQSYAQVLNKSKFAKRKEPKSRSSQNLLSKCLDVPNFKILEQDEIEEYDSSMS